MLTQKEYELLCSRYQMIRLNQLSHIPRDWRHTQHMCAVVRGQYTKPPKIIISLTLPHKDALTAPVDMQLSNITAIPLSLGRIRNRCI